MNAELLRELQDRGRFFYQNSPGAAAADEWKRIREKAEQEYATVLSATAGPEPEEDALQSSATSADALGTSTMQNPVAPIIANGIIAGA